MKMLSYLYLTLMLGLLWSFNSVAHTDEVLDSQPAPHGGQVRMAGTFHFELVVGDKQLTVYVTDHAGKSIATEGATGNAMVLVGKTKTTVELKPAEENVLKGDGEFTAAPEMKVVVSITLAGQEQQQARFTPLEKKASPAGQSSPSEHSQHSK
jgi:hypothetical protein